MYTDKQMPPAIDAGKIRPSLVHKAILAAQIVQCVPKFFHKWYRREEMDQQRNRTEKWVVRALRMKG